VLLIYLQDNNGLFFQGQTFRAAIPLRLNRNANSKKPTLNKLLILLTSFFTATVFGQTEQGKEPSNFLPKGYVIFERVTGDLNEDGTEDCILIIKGTDTSKIVTDEYRGKLDRNRRGIIVLFNRKDHYELAVRNYDCFSSENEDGGVYFPPELFIQIVKGNLSIHYGHGRYGYWKYTFRFQNSDFELIGYDASEGGVVTDNETSINFLTKKKQEKVNTNENAQGGDEVFKETWKEINVNSLLKLSEVKDFDDLDMSSYSE
jgi:hypothetical protein